MINITDYKRTGIFIEENVTPIAAQNAPLAPNVHFVPGFSRKSTVFNRPVLIKSTSDRKAYFGDIDRQLEKKGSFFHRTIDVALQTAPVYAMNLLKTNSLDVLDYASISLAAQYDNKPVLTEQYDSFFNKAGFWQRDTEAFIYFAKDTMTDTNKRKIHFTNVSDKKITFFMFKSTDPALEITAGDWYANKGEDIPTWIDSKSLMSDFLVRVIVVSGDFSNYAQLSVDQTFSKYFTSSGLRKEKVNDFLRDRLVTSLGDYTGSVIPYFTDMNGRNLFIESLINIETDKTGLFCAMDIDTIDTDYSTGVIDLIGETLVGRDKSRINYMSYYDTIEETDEYEQYNDDNRLGKQIVYNSNYTLTNSLTGVSMSTVDVYLIDLGRILFDNVQYNITTSLPSNIAFSNVDPLPSGSDTLYRTDVFYVTPNGVLEHLIGPETLKVGAAPTFSDFETNRPSNYPDGSYVLFYANIYFDSSGDKYVSFYETTSDGTSTISSFNYIDVTDLIGAVLGSAIQKIETSSEVEYIFEYSTNKSDYREYFIGLLYNITNNNVSNQYAYLELTSVGNPTLKKYISDCTVVLTSTPGYKAIKMVFDSNIPSGYTVNNIYYTDKMTKQLSTAFIGYSTINDGNHAVIGRESELYLDYVNGMINTGDYFYENFGLRTVKFSHITTGANIGKYVVFNSDPNINNNTTVIIPEYSDDKIKLIFKYDDPMSSVGTDLSLTPGQVAYSVNENIPVISTPFTSLILNEAAKVYLKMFKIGKDVTIDFYSDSTLTTPYGNLSLYTIAAPILVYSGESNYTQSLDIVNHPSYTITDTKFLIDMTRFNEVKVGDYVMAYYDPTELEVGEEPKRFARILKKTAWSGNVANNVQYAEITVDRKFAMVDGLSQTLRYTTIENYIDTYKAIVLNGFKVQPTSIPDGTETRQKEILSVIGKDSPLFNAIVNKQKFNFRYLIDSFGLGLTEFSKQELADVVGKRKNAIAFINAPSAKMFKNSTNPYFINDDGTLNMEYVKKGGDEERNPSFLYSFAQGSGKTDGRDCSAYVFPYVTINDLGRPLSFPPAAYAANTYMRKNGSVISGKYNFTVAAGVNDGLILGIANTEMDFTEFDYEQADAMGLNLISYNSNYGFYLETEYTAMRTPKTPLSNLHVRELLIDMENEMYSMLFKYQYQFNLPEVRARIKREADDICQKYYDRGGITYYENVIDESNNTADLIDNQFGLLETTIVPVSAMAKIVNIFNVTTNGALAGSTGFQ